MSITLDTLAELGTTKDVEVIWLDPTTHLPREMSSCIIEIYHYDSALPGIISSLNQEPYFITEGINDTLEIGSIYPENNCYIDSNFTLQLNLICDNLDQFPCKPNEYIVPDTNLKVAIINSRKVFALSACELSTLINLNASGYSASDVDGFVVLRGDYSAETAYLKVGSGNINPLFNIVEGDEFYGSNLKITHILEPVEMTKMQTGIYVYPEIKIQEPNFIAGERYFILVKAYDALTGRLEIYQEDWSVINKLPKEKNTLTYSFTK